MLVKVKVTRSVAVPGNDKQRVLDLRPGMHEVDDSIFSHWFVKSLVKKGVISVVKKKVLKTVVPPVVAPASVKIAGRKVEVEELVKKEPLREVQTTTIDSSVPEVTKKVATVTISSKPAKSVKPVAVRLRR